MTFLCEWVFWDISTTLYKSIEQVWTDLQDYTQNLNRSARLHTKFEQICKITHKIWTDLQDYTHNLDRSARLHTKFGQICKITHKIWTDLQFSLFIWD